MPTLYDWFCDTPLTCHGHTLPELDLTGANDWVLSYTVLHPTLL